jgi:hypothetical protein
MLLNLGIAGVIYKISKSWLAALLFWLTPYALVMALVLTVEIPFILFYLLTIYFLLEWLKNQKQKDLIWAAVFTGLGFVSKYSMILIFPTLFILICLPSSKKLRTIQNLKSFLIYAGIAGIIFSPVLLSNLFSGVYLTDMETCYKVFKSELIKSMNLTSKRFGIEVELTAYLAKTTARIFELPISYFPRTRLQGKKINWKDGLAALWFLFKFNKLTTLEKAFTNLPQKYINPQSKY